MIALANVHSDPTPAFTQDPQRTRGQYVNTTTSDAERERSDRFEPELADRRYRRIKVSSDVSSFFSDQVALNSEIGLEELATWRADSSIFSPQIAIKSKIESEELANGQVEGAKKRIVAQKAAEKRLEDLKELAAEEGCKISVDSERALRAFLAAVPFSKRPYINLLDNGNFRAFWEDTSTGEQIGLQFLGNTDVQFVIFARRQGESNCYIARTSGRDLVTNIDQQIETYGLRRLMS
jgi:hypothetical protein